MPVLYGFFLTYNYDKLANFGRQMVMKMLKNSTLQIALTWTLDSFILFTRTLTNGTILDVYIHLCFFHRTYYTTNLQHSTAKYAVKIVS